MSKNHSSYFSQLYTLASIAVSGKGSPAQNDFIKIYCALFESLKSAFITPVEREDIMESAQLLRELLVKRNLLESSRTLSGISLPGETEELFNYIRGCFSGVCDIFSALTAYPDTSESYSACSGLQASSEKLLSMCAQVQENSHSSKFSISYIMSLNDIIYHISDCASACLNIACRTELMLIKNS